LWILIHHFGRGGGIDLLGGDVTPQALENGTATICWI
jgi:hypothetical protein